MQALEVIKKVAEENEMKWNVLITLDVRNAFNSASWNLILNKLENRKISTYLINVIEDYLKERHIQVTKKDSLKIHGGVPQGSILGPTLWNILYNDLLETALEGRAKTIAFADDLALIVTADTKADLVRITNENLKRVSTWMRNNELKLAPQKTEALVMTKRRKREGLMFKLDNVDIKPKNTIKYLGIFLDTAGSFREHIRKTTEKAEDRIAKIIRIMPNIGGPVSSKRALLAAVVHSILLYGAPIWEEALKVNRNWLLLQKAQRKILIRVAAAYKTAPTTALQVISGIPPIDLLVQERKRMYDEKGEKSVKNERSITLNIWQKRWQEHKTTGQWTKQLIPELKPWIDCKHKSVDYYLTQILTGHGVFRTYANRIGKVARDDCVYCGATDTVEHTIFHCKRWEAITQATCRKVGQEIKPKNIVEIMMKSKDDWDLVHNMIKSIMKTKEEEERRLQSSQ